MSPCDDCRDLLRYDMDSDLYFCEECDKKDTEIERLREHAKETDRYVSTLRSRLEKAIEPVGPDGKSNLDILIRIENNMEPTGCDFEDIGILIDKLRGEES